MVRDSGELGEEVKEEGGRGGVRDKEVKDVSRVVGGEVNMLVEVEGIKKVG